MTFIAANKLILAKAESTYGTDSTPIEGSNPILTKNLTRRIYQGSTIQRDLDLPTLGGDEMINVGPSVEVTFDVEVGGASAAGQAPAYGTLLVACGMSQTLSAGTSATYRPVSTGFGSVTLYYNVDGEMQAIVGARGTVSIKLNRGQIPVYSFRFIGIYARPTAVNQYAPTFTQLVGRPMNDSNTTTFSVHQQAVVGDSFEMDLNNEIVYRNLAGFTGVNLVNRDVKGRVVFEAPLLSTKDFYAAAESHAGTVTKDAISIVHGSAAGAICTITAPTAQLQGIEEQDSDGIKMYEMPYGAIPTEAGNDEFSIVYT
jgi:hypothetical protein